MDLDAGILWDFAGEVVGRIRPTRSTVPATVTRVDADGTAWVTTGDGMEAPVQQLSSLVQPGDVVDVQWSGSAARIVANGSDPSAGERAVREARRVARTAQTLAKDAKAIADATGQFFWHDDSGAHVSTEKGNAAGKQNALWNSLGMLFRTGANNLLALVTGTDPGMDVYDGGGNEDENVLVSVRGSGTRIGYADGFNTIIQAAQFAIRYATDRLFNVSTDGQSVDIYMGGSTAASGTSYTDAKVEAVAAYLNDGCTVDGTAILDPQGVATGYTLDANGFVLDAGGDQFESGKYQGIYYATSTQTFGLEPQLTPQSEIPGAPVSIDMGNTTVNAANGKAWLTGGFYWRYYPSVKAQPLSPLTAIFHLTFAALCFTPLILNIYADLSWKKRIEKEKV